MKRALVFAHVLAFCSLALASSSPEDRAITDPRSVTSESNSRAHAVPIGDLYYTRSSGGAAWSPDGSEIVFTTDMTGRPNLWKVRASGGWPVQLVQSDERQYAAAWSPDGKWIVYQQDKGGNEMWDLYAIPSDGGEAVNLRVLRIFASRAPSGAMAAKCSHLDTSRKISRLRYRPHGLGNQGSSQADE